MVKTEQLVLPQLILKSDLTEKSVKGGVFQTKSLPQCSVGINSGFQPHRLLTHVVMWASFQVQPRRSATTRVIPYVTPNYMLEWYGYPQNWLPIGRKGLFGRENAEVARVARRAAGQHSGRLVEQLQVRSRSLTDFKRRECQVSNRQAQTNYIRHVCQVSYRHIRREPRTAWATCLGSRQLVPSL